MPGQPPPPLPRAMIMKTTTITVNIPTAPTVLYFKSNQQYLCSLLRQKFPYEPSIPGDLGGRLGGG